MITAYKAKVLERPATPFPQDSEAQLWGAIGAVFGSWMNPRAETYRRLQNIPASWGTAVNVQSMVFGNMGETSATGVAFTRNPSTGDNALYGEFLINAQGEDVVAGIRTPQNITEVARTEAGSDKPSMETALPEVFAEFERTCDLLETHYRDMQDMEFTVEDGKLWMLQTRSGKRTAQRLAADRGGHGERGADHPRGGGAAHRPDRARPAAPPDDRSRRPSARSSPPGLPASPGAASGEIVFNSEDAEIAKAAGKAVILVRVETSPDDIHGMHVSEGILTTRGGMTSHAAVVARGMGKPCVSGAGTIRVDYKAQTMTSGGVTFKKGDILTIDGGNGQVMAGRGADAAARSVGRVRDADGMGGRFPAHGRSRQCRDAAGRPRRARLRRAGHRALPDGAHVLRGRSHHRGARDDPRRGRGGPAQRAREAAAVPARRLRRAVRDHVRPAGLHPAARSAAARVPAAQRRGNRGGRGIARCVDREATAPRRGTARVQPDAGLPGLSPGDRLPGNRRDAGPCHLRRGGRRQEENRRRGDARGHGAARHRQGGVRHRQGGHRHDGDPPSRRKPAKPCPTSSAR